MRSGGVTASYACTMTQEAWVGSKGEYQWLWFHKVAQKLEVGKYRQGEQALPINSKSDGEHRVQASCWPAGSQLLGALAAPSLV